MYGAILQLPPGGHSIQPSGRTKGGPGRIGQLFEANLIGAYTRRDWVGPGHRGQGLFEGVQGLAINLEAGSGGNAARLRLTTGAPFGGASKVVEFTLTPQGLWIVAAGWGNAKLEILTVEDDDTETGTVVTWTWTNQPPRPPSRLRLVEAVGIGTFPIPNGAIRVATSASDPGWEYVTDDGSGALIVSQPQPGGGEPLRVLGATFTSTVAQPVTWLLETQ